MGLKLSKRLSAVADMITKGGSVADIGTDHGYIPIYLALNGYAPYALAMDIGEGPLERAADNIRSYGVGDRVFARRSDGLDGLRAAETDTIVIAGMGGRLIVRILGADLDKAHAAGELVLSPQSDVWLVRSFLAKNSFAVTDERIVREDGKFYFILRAVNGNSPMPSGAALYYGKPLLERRDGVLLEYLEHELALRERILADLESGSAGNAGRIGEVKAELAVIAEGLGYYEGF